MHPHADSHSECRSNPGSVCAMHSIRTMIQVHVYLKEDELDRADCGVPPPSDAPVCDRGVCEGLLRVIALISFFIKMRQSHSIGSAHMRLKKASETQWRQKLVPRCPRDIAIMIVTSSMAHVFWDETRCLHVHTTHKKPKNKLRNRQTKINSWHTRPIETAEVRLQWPLPVSTFFTMLGSDRWLGLRNRKSERRFSNHTKLGQWRQF